MDATGPLAPPAVIRQNDELISIGKSIEQQELFLQSLRQRFRPGYPDIKETERAIAVLQKKREDIEAAQIKALAEEAAKPKPAVRKSTNFKALESQTQIQGEVDRYNGLLKNNDAERDFKLKLKDDYDKQIADYRARLAATSLLEAPYADLKRDYQAAADKYEKYQKQKDLTSQSAELISRRATEYLDQLDAPTMPQRPVSPQRPIIVGAGFALSLMIGLAVAGVQEARDASLKNLKDVRAYTNLPVLCSIPLLENTLLVKRKRRITALAWSLALVVGILAVCGSLFYYYSVIYIT
jgi:uncharacterized protein involved in exopolysaccharide biosynthesis